MDLSQTVSEKGGGISNEEGVENLLDHIGFRHGAGICMLYRGIDLGGGSSDDESPFSLWDWLGDQEW